MVKPSHQCEGKESHEDRRTVPAHRHPHQDAALLRQDLLHPERAENGYRWYDASALYRVQQIRGLLDSGLTTEIIRRILPFLTEPDEIHVHPECLTPDAAALLQGEADRIQERIDCLARNRDAILACLSAVRPGTAPPSGQV